MHQADYVHLMVLEHPVVPLGDVGTEEARGWIGGPWLIIIVSRTIVYSL